ncbi:hypothetical protein FRC15_001348 [Serendipita sp. 397]|nr:hypothetical protein FRC15_001348 [Serendipita sp. 397]
MSTQTASHVSQSSGRVTRSQDASARPKSTLPPRPKLYRFPTADQMPRNASNIVLSADRLGNTSLLSRLQAGYDNNFDDTQLLNTVETQSSPLRPRTRAVASQATHGFSPFGETYNKRSGVVRRARISTSEKSRKRRSLEKPTEPELLGAQAVPAHTLHPKPRVSAPSRIPGPVRAAVLSAPVTGTPERSERDVEGLLKTQEASLKKLSLAELSAQDSFEHSPTLSPPEVSPSARKGPKMMQPLHLHKDSSDLLDYFFDDPIEVPNPRFLSLSRNAVDQAQPRSGLERQVSQAHVLFGGPAILSPAVGDVPPSSSQTLHTGDDDDDDEFFRVSSPIEPGIAEPGIVKKFKPRDSGVVVTDDSEEGSPILKSISSIRNGPMLRSAVSGPGLDNLTPTTSGLRRLSGKSTMPSGMGTKQPALQVLFDTAAGARETEIKTRPRTPVKKVHPTRIFASVPRAPVQTVPMIAKGRKSMPNSRLELERVARKDPSEVSPSTAIMSPVQMLKHRPTILTDFLRRCDQPGLTSAASSADSLSTVSSLEDTPTRNKAGLPLPRDSASNRPAARRASSSRRTSHRLQVVETRVSNEDEEGRFTNQFQVLGELGQGQFGVVLRVHDRLRNGIYAVKKSTRYTGPRHRNRLREEVDVLKGLSELGGHVNVLSYVDSWDEDDHLYIQTELCQMGNLATFLNEYGKQFDRLSEAYIWKILADVGDGLRFIHASGYIHLDLKPANILVSDEGRLIIGDFGMASAWPRQMTGDFEREGDREYMAPEILRGVYGKAADMFSLGMVILEATANIVVPDMGTPWHKLRHEDFDDVNLEGTSAVLVRLIRGLMRTDPTKRLTIDQVCGASIVGRARTWMNAKRAEAKRGGRSAIFGSPLAEEGAGFVKDVLRVEDGMKLGLGN